MEPAGAERHGRELRRVGSLARANQTPYNFGGNFQVTPFSRSPSVPRICSSYPFGQLSDFVWGPPLLILLLGTHIFLTFRLRFIQRYIGKAIKLSVQRSHEGQGDVSQSAR